VADSQARRPHGSAHGSPHGSRHAHDAAFFDRVWRERAAREGDLRIPADEQMLRRDLGRSLGYVFTRLGDLRGRRVLELGCGVGDYTVLWARRGAQVLATDVSPASIAITRARAAANGLAGAITALCMPAEALALPDGVFDWVIGFGVLHHAEVARAGAEACRVLRPGGRALFREPLGGNPLLEFARRHLPYRDKERTPFERPLSAADIDAAGAHFARRHTREFYLFSMITRAVGHEHAFPWLWSLDEALFTRFPAVRRWARYVVVEYAKGL
jgi:SAM-dependent methyltransferase